MAPVARARPPSARRPRTGGNERHAARPQGRSDRTRLRHPHAPVRRPSFRGPHHREADGQRDVRRPRQHHPADHRARLGLRDDGADAGAARHLRVPQPQGRHLRRTLDRPLGLREGARRLGRVGRERHALAPDRGAALVSTARRLPRVARRVLPHASLVGPLRLPAGSSGGDRRGARGEGSVHLRHPELPEGRLRRHVGPGVQDDRAAVPGGAETDPEQALGLLHALRHRAGPAPSRLLAIRRSGAPAARAGQ